MDIKKAISESKFKQWEIAEMLNISEFTLCRWLRKPDKLSQEKRDKIEAAVEQRLVKED